MFRRWVLSRQPARLLSSSLTFYQVSGSGASTPGERSTVTLNDEHFKIIARTILEDIYHGIHTTRTGHLPWLTLVSQSHGFIHYHNAQRSSNVARHPIHGNMTCHGKAKKELNLMWQLHDALCHIDEHIYIVLVSLHVLVFNQPLNLFFDELFWRQEHVA